MGMNGTIEGCDVRDVPRRQQHQRPGQRITSDIEAIDFLSFTPSTMTGQMVFKMAGGNPPGFPAHNAGKDLLLYNGTFGAGNCVVGGAPCADDGDCASGACNTGSCAIGATACASDGDCSGSGNSCNSTRFPTGTVTKYFDGVAVGLSGAGQDIEALAILQDADGDGIPDGIDNCPTVINPPSICSDGVSMCPSGLSSECPMGATCVQADSDGDGVGDACDQCNGRPDPGTCDGCPSGFCPAGCMGNPANACSCGDGIVDHPSEQCDLGSQNGQTGSPCSSTCKISGKCNRQQTGDDAVTTAADCPRGEGCCGNDITRRQRGL